MDRNTAMALQVAQGAWDAAGLADADLDRDRLGIFWGSGMGGAWTFDQTCRTVYGEHKRIRPTAVVSTMPNAAVAEISLMAKAQGMTQTYACACASSAVALGEALMALRAGRIDVAIVGGSEAMLTPGVVASWHAMRVLAPAGDDARQACKPFDAHRNGFALGEGAAAFILESETHAQRRNARRLATLAGYGTSTDAVHMTNPDPAGQVKAMRMALNDAQLTPQDIGYINAHGTATTAGDLAECASIAQVFAGHAVPVSSTKAMHGHLLGAGGALELLVAMQTLMRQKLPLAVNLQQLEPQCGLNLVRTETDPLQPLRHAMSNSFAFGGTNAVLIVSI
jgi:3-oxoacyl-[acyl-carrier-protein] synthase II